jgi:hypothetical protein
MTSKKTLNATNLEALGAQRLAELLMDIAEGDAATKRRLRLELTVLVAPKAMAAEVRKRLSQIAGARSFVDRRKMRDFAADLEAQRRAINDHVAARDPGEALELMWRFLQLAETVYARSDDSDGVIGDIFRDACRDLGSRAQAAKPDPVALADRVFAALANVERTPAGAPRAPPALLDHVDFYVTVSSNKRRTNGSHTFVFWTALFQTASSRLRQL